jgi:hypothetical protein
VTSQTDPVLARRARFARAVSLGLWGGAGLYALASVLFAVAVTTRFSGFLTSTITVCLILGSFLLGPAIVFHYAIKAAERADRDETW